MVHSGGEVQTLAQRPEHMKDGRDNERVCKYWVSLGFQMSDPYIVASQQGNADVASVEGQESTSQHTLGIPCNPDKCECSQ